MHHLYNLDGSVMDVYAPRGADWDKIVKAVAHRGYSTVAPENTAPAYILAAKKGFKYVETDVEFTSDGVAVCLHDTTVDRTSDGEGNIHDLTYAEVSALDFGSWKSSAYTETKILKFEDFIKLCRALGLYPYIELKSGDVNTEAQIQGLVDIVAACGMKSKVTWISFWDSVLGWVADYDEEARLGFVVETVNATNITKAQALLTGSNKVFLDSSDRSAEAVALALAAELPLEVWTIDNEATILALDPYITGVTSNSKIAGMLLYENAIKKEETE